MTLTFCYLKTKDIEDSSVSDSDLEIKCLTYTDELKKKLRDVKIPQQDDCSLLHLAARFKRDQFCLFLIEELKIGILFCCLFSNNFCFL